MAEELVERCSLIWDEWTITFNRILGNAGKTLTTDEKDWREGREYQKGNLDGASDTI